MNNNILVKKSNQLVNSCYNLSLIEHRFIALCSGNVHFTTEITPRTECKISLERYAEEFMVTLKEARSQFKEIKESLLTKKVTIKGFVSQVVSWVTKIDLYTNNEAYIMFDEEVIPHLFRLNNGFIRYDVKYLSYFKSPNSIRLYELCKSNAYEKEKFIYRDSLIDFKKKLCIEENYKQCGSLNRQLDKWIKEINNYSDLEIELTEEKKGKQVASLSFAINLKGKTNGIEIPINVDKPTRYGISMNN